MYYQFIYRNCFIEPDIYSNIHFHSANMCGYYATDIINYIK